MGIGLVSAFGESLFVVAAGKRFGSKTAAMTLLFLMTNCGMRWCNCDKES